MYRYIKMSIETINYVRKLCVKIKLIPMWFLDDSSRLMLQTHCHTFRSA